MSLLIIFLVLGSEPHFRSTLGPDRAAAILRSLQTASATAREIAVTYGFSEARTEPSVAFDLGLNALSDLDHLPGVVKTKSKQQHLWIIDGVYALRIKKLRDGYKTSNHESRQQARIRYDLPLEGMASLIYVTAGTRYSERTGLPVEWVAVKHYPGPQGEQKVEWVVDLQELAEGGGESTTFPLPLPTAPVAPPAVIRSKSRGNAQEGT